jgi:hypothetical protein
VKREGLKDEEELQSWFTNRIAAHLLIALLTYMGNYNGSLLRGFLVSFFSPNPSFLQCARSAEFLGESNEKPFRPSDVAKSIHVLILDDFADQLRAALVEPF